MFEGGEGGESGEGWLFNHRNETLGPEQRYYVFVNNKFISSQRDGRTTFQAADEQKEIFETQ